jgi:hypothetical protein
VTSCERCVCVERRSCRNCIRASIWVVVRTLDTHEHNGMMHQCALTVWIVLLPPGVVNAKNDKDQRRRLSTWLLTLFLLLLLFASIWSDPHTDQRTSRRPPPAPICLPSRTRPIGIAPPALLLTAPFIQLRFLLRGPASTS